MNNFIIAQTKQNEEFKIKTYTQVKSLDNWNLNMTLCWKFKYPKWLSTKQLYLLLLEHFWDSPNKTLRGHVNVEALRNGKQLQDAHKKDEGKIKESESTPPANEVVKVEVYVAPPLHKPPILFPQKAFLRDSTLQVVLVCEQILCLINVFILYTLILTHLTNSFNK